MSSYCVCHQVEVTVSDRWLDGLDDDVILLGRVKRKLEAGFFLSAKEIIHRVLGLVNLVVDDNLVNVQLRRPNARKAEIMVARLRRMICRAETNCLCSDSLFIHDAN